MCFIRTQENQKERRVALLLADVLDYIISNYIVSVKHFLMVGTGFITPEASHKGKILEFCWVKSKVRTEVINDGVAIAH